MRNSICLEADLYRERAPQDGSVESTCYVIPGSWDGIHVKVKAEHDWKVLSFCSFKSAEYKLKGAGPSSRMRTEVNTNAVQRLQYRATRGTEVKMDDVISTSADCFGNHTHLP